MGSQIGVAIAAVVMIGGTEILRELDFLKRIFGPDFDPTQYRMLIFGFGMVVMMIWKPRGIISTREPSIFLKERKAISAIPGQGGARLMRWQSDPLLVVEHVSRCGSAASWPSTICRSGRPRRHHRADRPQRRRQDHGLQLRHGFLQADGGPACAGPPGRYRGGGRRAVTLTRSAGKKHMRGQSGDLFLLERMPDHEISRTAKVARTFQNIRLFTGMTVLENLLVAQHNRLMIASGMTFLGVLGIGGYKARETRPSKRRNSGSSRSASRPRRRSRGRSALW